MGVTWETSFDAALGKARETGRPAMAWFHSPY